MCQVWHSHTLSFLTKTGKQWPWIVQRCFFGDTTSYQAKKRNHYETLGVKSDATSKEIKAAFVARSKKVHPDMNHGDPKLHHKFVKLNEAYSTLIKPKVRRKYDESIGLSFYYKDPTFSEMNPRPYNPYQYGPPPPSMGTEQFYQEMLRQAKRESIQRQKGTGKAHSSPFYTFSPFFLTLGGFTVVYWVFVYDNENDRHNRIKVAHELRWKHMEEENKVLLAQRKLREQEAKASGTYEEVEHTHVEAVKEKKKTRRKRRPSFRERKRIAKQEALEKTKGTVEKKSDSVNETKSDKDS